MLNWKQIVLSNLVLLVSYSLFSQTAWQEHHFVKDPQITQPNETALSNEAPVIIVRDKPSTLVWMDGDPIVVVDEDLRMYRIVNTPNLIIKNHNDNKYYLYGGKCWYVSDSAATGYKYKKVVPDVIRLMDSLVKRTEYKSAVAARTLKPLKPVLPPEVVVSKEQCELIYTTGTPVFKNIEGTGLAYVVNSPNNIFIDTISRFNYVLLSGRWYRSALDLSGPWKYIPADRLPADFSMIPASSPKANVLVHVSGTDAAKQAAAEAGLISSRKIKRYVDSNIVVYDGGPEFSSFSYTGMFIAENSNVPVINEGNKYYALKEGVWFISEGNPSGPWEVSTARPAEIEKLSPDHRFYYARNVYVTDTTSEYVTTAYTAGYLNTYIQNNVIVYGTGYSYKPWCRRRFFIRPLTWTYSVSYDPSQNWMYQPAPLSLYKVKL